jgi:hypothetical protein
MNHFWAGSDFLKIMAHIKKSSDVTDHQHLLNLIQIICKKNYKKHTKIQYDRIKCQNKQANNLLYP